MTEYPENGLRINLSRYFPDVQCAGCGRFKAADNYLKTSRVQSGGRREYRFGDKRLCLSCDPPVKRLPPADSGGVRLAGQLADQTGLILQWRERNGHGPFGQWLPISLMQFRLIRGVLLPQPKRDRRSAEELQRHPYGKAIQMNNTYLMTDGVAFKIGRGVDLLRRRKGLQTGNPRALRIVAYIPGDCERMLKNRFTRLGLRLRPDGEWFRRDVRILEEFRMDRLDFGRE